MPHSIIRTDEDLEAYHALQRTLKKPFTAQHRQGADRSLEQNALQFQWANDTARQRGDCTFNEVRLDWKLRHGVPILRRDSEGFRAMYDRVIKPLPFELKLTMMERTNVTSEFTVKQMREYLDTVQRECAEQGVRLTDPTTLKQEAAA